MRPLQATALESLEFEIDATRGGAATRDSGCQHRNELGLLEVERAVKGELS